MGEVCKLHEFRDIPKNLRDLAERIEKGEVIADGGCTIVVGESIYHYGETVSDGAAVREAIFNLRFGEYTLMRTMMGD